MMMKTDELVERAKLLIEREYDAPAALVRSLGEIGVSRRHLNELFEARYDRSMQEYANQVRLERAREMLRDGCSITDTAFAVGMGSSASFAKFFRKAAGMTPSEFVRNGLEANPVCYYRSPVGVMRLSEDARGLRSICFADGAEGETGGNAGGAYLPEAVRELEEYFRGERRGFDLPLSPRGTEFQQRVWAELQNIPYGETRSYQEVARSVGNEKAARAVGMAANKNPLLILIPCHRLVGKDNQLVGYAGGLERKRYLLDMERRGPLARFD